MTIIDLVKIADINVEINQILAKHELNLVEQIFVIEQHLQILNVMMADTKEQSLFLAKKSLGGMN